MTVRDTGGNVKVDFVWGNLPLQPDDDRGAHTLDAALDSHSIATTGWGGYPSFLPNDTDAVANVVVPSLVGRAAASVTATLAAYGLIAGTDTETTTGATLANDLLVKTQSPAAGTVVNAGAAVSCAFYNYTPAVPNVVGMLPAAATTALAAVGMELAATPGTSAAGATAENDGTIKSQNPAAAATADISASNTVAVVLYAYVAG